MKETKIDIDVNSLLFIKRLKDVCDLYFVGELEIEPYTVWTDRFATVYWYTKYHLLRDSQFDLTSKLEDLDGLLDEQNLNIIWLTLTDKINFTLKVTDGNWTLICLSNNGTHCDQIASVLKQVGN